KDASKEYLDSSRNWYIYLKGEYRDYLLEEDIRNHNFYIEGLLAEYEELGIDYCLLITIYDPEETVDVYGAVLNELDAQVFSYEELTIEDEIVIESDTTLDT